MDDVKDLSPRDLAGSASAAKIKGKETQIEVLNPAVAVGTVASHRPRPLADVCERTQPRQSPSSDAIPTIPEGDTSTPEGEVPQLTPAGRAWIEIGLRDYDRSFAFIQRDPSVLAEATTDACLGEAFEAELAGDKAKAKRCVHQGLLIQYCRKLGRDGVRLFFKR